MNLSIALDQNIRGPRTDSGRLELIDDVGVSPEEAGRLLNTFTLPAAINPLTDAARELWDLIQRNTLPGRRNVLFVCPGNGAWLVERSLGQIGVTLDLVLPVSFSREGICEIHITGDPDQIVILEDVVETGNTARLIREHLVGVSCPVTLATTFWHDRESQTEQVLRAFELYDQVLVARRLRSDHPKDDLRSISTLARKAKVPNNQRYSQGKERDFERETRSILKSHRWLCQLGGDLGYRHDPHSVTLTTEMQLL